MVGASKPVCLDLGRLDTSIRVINYLWSHLWTLSLFRCRWSEDKFDVYNAFDIRTFVVCLFANNVYLLDSIQTSFESNCLDRRGTNLDNNVSSEGKDVSILFLVKWLDRNKFAFRVVHFRKNIVAGCAKVPHRYFRSTCVRSMHIEGFSSGRTVGARGYSNHPFSFKRKGADTRREEGGSAVWTTGCASLLLAYSRSRSFAFVLFQRNYMNWFLIAIDMPENINRWTTTWTGKLTFQRFL